jgi:hypothetical protein
VGLYACACVRIIIYMYVTAQLHPLSSMYSLIHSLTHSLTHVLVYASLFVSILCVYVTAQ